MHFQISKTFLKAFVALVFFSTFGWASDRHHELNGTWTLVPTRSEFGGEPALQMGTVTINDREGNITISRNFTYDGATQTVSYSSSIDGKVNHSIHDGPAFTSKAKWEGDVLESDFYSGRHHNRRTFPACQRWLHAPDSGSALASP